LAVTGGDWLWDWLWTWLWTWLWLLSPLVESADFDNPIVGDGTTLLTVFADWVGAGWVGVGGNNFATVFEVVTGVADGVGFVVELLVEIVAGLGGGLLVGDAELTFAELELLVVGAVGFGARLELDGGGASGLGIGAVGVAELALAVVFCGAAEGVCFALELELDDGEEELFDLGSGSCA
jgi:hypothetical protein